MSLCASMRACVCAARAEICGRNRECSSEEGAGQRRAARTACDVNGRVGAAELGIALAVVLVERLLQPLEPERGLRVGLQSIDGARWPAPRRHRRAPPPLAAELCCQAGVRYQQLGPAEGGRGIPFAAGVHHQFDLRAERFPGCGDVGDIDLWVRAERPPPELGSRAATQPRLSAWLSDGPRACGGAAEVGTGVGGRASHSPSAWASRPRAAVSSGVAPKR